MCALWCGYGLLALGHQKLVYFVAKPQPVLIKVFLFVLCCSAH